MARRKIVGGPEELEHRLLHVLTNTDRPVKTRHSGAQINGYIAAILALSHLYKVDLGPRFEKFVDKLTINRSAIKTESDAPMPVVSEDQKESLTVEPPTGIFDDLEEKDE